MRPAPNSLVQPFLLPHLCYGPNGIYDANVYRIDGMLVTASANPVHGWEHITVTPRDRCPTWDEMCKIKNLFFEEEETVVQFHPPKSQYVNFNPFALHLWRPLDDSIKTPPVWYLLGPSIPFQLFDRPDLIHKKQNMRLAEEHF